MMCDCERSAQKARARRVFSNRYQLKLPFPNEESKPARRTGPSITVLARQPARFPEGWYRLALADPDWRVAYEADWVRRRKAEGLPHHIINPALPRKKSPASVRPVDAAQFTERSEGTSAGNAVLGRLSDPRQMTAGRPVIHQIEASA